MRAPRFQDESSALPDESSALGSAELSQCASLLDEGAELPKPPLVEEPTQRL